jgi:hypothetical protein
MTSARSNARSSGAAQDDDTLTIGGLSYSLQRQANSTYRIANGRRTHIYTSSNGPNTTVLHEERS